MILLIIKIAVTFWGNPSSFAPFSIISLFFTLIYALIVYFSGDQIILKMNGAKEITKQSNKRIYNIVENLCITAGLPMPKIYEIPDQSLNAFATGRNPKHSAVAFTTGILEKLNDREIAGVAAHELAHVKNYDTLIMLVALVLVNVIQILAEILLRSTASSSSQSDSKSNAGVFILIALVVYIFGSLIAILVQQSISRRREFIADSNAALLTRDPQALADALKKISHDSRIEAIDGKRAFASLYISNPLKPGWFEKLMSTHPPIEKRIEILEKMGNI